MLNFGKSPESRHHCSKKEMLILVVSQDAGMIRCPRSVRQQDLPSLSSITGRELFEFSRARGEV